MLYVFFRQSSVVKTAKPIFHPANGPDLKYGFQWLKDENAVDADVDEKANASFLEYLVFKYDFLTEYFVSVEN